MNFITPDAATQAQLKGLDQLTQIRDDQGNVLGVYTPLDQFEELKYAQAVSKLDPQVKDRRKASNVPRLSTEEVLDRLKSLETSE